MNDPDRELVTVRTLDAPPDLVYRVWIDPRHLSKWWGPDGFTTTIHEMQVRPGGLWRYTMHGPDGRDYRNRVIFQEVDPPRRLVFRHEPETGDEPVGHTTHVTFELVGSKTRVTLRGVFASAEALRHVVETYGAAVGAEQTMARFAALVADLRVENQ